MLPPPPDLAERVGQWRDQELFWVVKHGLKYAGMPAWVAQDRDDEVWAVVAFIRLLPRMTPESYQALALGEARLDRPGDKEIASGEMSPDGGRACARCHGLERGPPSTLTPWLHGQSAPALLAALRAFASGERHSGVMQTAVAGLPDGTLRKLADYYASLPRPQPAKVAPAAAHAIERGGRLAREGDAESDVPACLECHAAGALPVYPRLAGQSARYLAGQLRAWQSGPKGTTAANAIMAPIARRLTSRQIEDVAAYFASANHQVAMDGGAP